MHKLISASEYCDNVFDGTHDTPKPKLEGKPLITSKHILGNKLDIVNAYNISSEDYDEINKRSQIHQWDILFSMIGTIGNIYLEESSDINYAIKNIGVFSCREEKKARYLYYYLQSSFAKQYIYKKLAGAVQKFLSLGELRCFPVPCFDEQLYNNINILAWIDKKIGLNNRINAELEVVARELYNYWFVQFDFPDEFRRPYKSSGGKMVYNDVLKREIPEGWEVKSLGDICNLYQPETISEKDCMPNGKYYVYGSNGIIGKYDRKNHDESEIVVSCRGDCGNVIRTMPNVWITGNAMVVHPKSGVDQEFIYFALQNAGIKRIITGSVQGQITRKNLEPVKMVIPPTTLLEQYEKLICNNVTIRIQNNIETELLQNLRDFLLPMLMNGQVSVSD